MKQVFDRIAASILGVLLLFLIEGIMTLGSAFRFEHYTALAYTVQGMLVYVAVWSANKIYDAERGGK